MLGGCFSEALAFEREPVITAIRDRLRISNDGKIERR
jgi:hypothetical protein